MALSFNGIPWANMRGYCYSGYESGNPPELPSKVFPAWKNGLAPTFPVQVNFGRFDYAEWLGFYNGGPFFNPGQTFPNPTAVAQFKQVILDIVNAADAAGITLVFNGIFDATFGAFPLPSVPNNASTGVAWYNNHTYPGTEPPYQGLSYWDACWQGFTLPLLQLVDSHKSVIGYKIANEPGQGGELSQVPNVNTVLKNVGNFLGQKMRAFGSTKALIFQTRSENPASGGTSGPDIIEVAPSSAFAPLLFSIHYPDPNATSVANCVFMNIIQNTIAGGQVPGCQGWYIDESGAIGWSDNVHLQACKQFGIPGPLAFTWRKGTLLDSTTGNPLPETLFVSSQALQFLGVPQYFGAGPPPPPPPPPPPTPTTLTLKATVL